MDLLKHVSIIIPAWNDRNVLGDTLNGLLDIDFDKKLCQIIVVAGGGDGTYEFANSVAHNFQEFKSFLVLPQEPNGKNAALKKGISYIDNRSEIVVLLDADTQVDKYWLKKIVNVFNNSNYDALNGDYESIRKESYISYFYLFEKIRSNIIDTNASLYGGGSIAFKSSILKDEGISEKLFATDVNVGVDYNFSEVLKSNNYKLGFARNACVYTYLPRKFKEFIRNERRWIPAWITLSSEEKWFKSYLLKNSSLFVLPLLFVALSSIYSSFWEFFILLNIPLFYYIIKCFIKGCSIYKIYGKKLHSRYIISYIFLNLIIEFLVLYEYVQIKLGFYVPNKFFKGPRSDT